MKQASNILVNNESGWQNTDLQLQALSGYLYHMEAHLAVARSGDTGLSGSHKQDERIII